MFLTADEIATLTGHARSDAQRRELDHLGVPYRQRRDNSLVVLAIHVELLPGGTVAPAAREPEMHL